MPKSLEQLEQIRSEKRTLIMETSLKLFAEQGFHATSISQITKKAGISKGLVYNYFESKNEILSEIMKWAFENIYSNFDFKKDGRLTIVEFVSFIRFSLRSSAENRTFWKLYYALMFQPQILESYSTQYAEKGQKIAKMLHDYIIEQGSPDPDRDLFAISSLIKGATLLIVNAPDMFPIDDVEEDTIQSCLKLIRY